MDLSANEDPVLHINKQAAEERDEKREQFDS